MYLQWLPPSAFTDSLKTACPALHRDQNIVVWSQENVDNHVIFILFIILQVLWVLEENSTPVHVIYWHVEYSIKKL